MYLLLLLILSTNFKSVITNNKVGFWGRYHIIFAQPIVHLFYKMHNQLCIFLKQC